MSRKKLIMGNWKMNGDKASLHALAQHIAGIQPRPNSEIVVFPPYVYLDKTHWELRNTQIKLGAQDVSQHDNGAHTGDISANMLKDMGCEYVLIGHSERRQSGETDILISHKVIKAIGAGLKVVLCVGETQDQKLKHLTEQIVLAQLESVLNLRAIADGLSQLIIAYEPVWAIGTGLTATPSEAQKVHNLLREAVKEKDKKLAENIPIVYGGSVKASNAKDLFNMADIDGALVGGASLNGQEFREICHAVEF